MLFNSYAFILLFLPVTLGGYLVLRAADAHRLAFAWLAAASLAFYGWWSLKALALLVALMGANYIIVSLLLRTADGSPPVRRALVALAIAGNLAVLGYFKYANFFLENWTALTHSQFEFVQVVLPLGLSFFTFQKIALLVDAYRGKVSHLDPLGYMLFVSFFPQLIAGPIVHHSEVMPQFADPDRPIGGQIAQGLMLFSLGLAKKVLLADGIAGWVGPVFDAAGPAHLPTAAEAWIATLAYALQLYFDFSGYSDMAIGLALMFGIRLPLNFNSPYKAKNIIDFWRRWHMTLSRFLRDYLYVPLGGNQRGQLRRQINLMITMVLGGLWHGAAWTFVVWGALHGLYLIVNHAWGAVRVRFNWRCASYPLTRGLAQLTTFAAVLVAWVFFRAPDLDAAWSILQAMAGQAAAATSAFDDMAALPWLAALLAIVWLAPNSAEVVGYTFAGKPLSLSGATAWWSPSWRWATACGLLAALCLMSMTRVSEFLYFQF
jgi:alginate O-acetyltransferase complex protein AlgI